MINAIFSMLEAVGFTHPLHPVVTHIPMGLVLGGCIFALLSLFREEFFKTALHCLMGALVLVPPSIIFGIMDWQYRFKGVWGGEFIGKFILAFTITILLAINIYIGIKENPNKKLFVGIYLLCAINAIGLGFLGAEILFG